MLLLAPGPVPIDETLAAIGGVRILPYFRGRDFANLMIELTEDAKVLFDTRATPLTISATGTGLMEMAIVNLLDPGDRVVVLNGGNFGRKWVRMCQAFRVETAEFAIPLGRSPDMARLEEFIPAGTKALMVNAHETSTGYSYDLAALGAICRRKGILFIVDGVSGIGADEYRMDEWGIDCSMVSTQKALGVMPGLGFIAFSERALAVVPTVSQPRCYFDALDYLNNIPRGMTPFTSAMVAVLQVREQLGRIREIGMAGFVERHRTLAAAFRSVFDGDPRFGIFPERPSNALTALSLPPEIASSRLVEILRDEYDWWLAPNPTKSEDFIRISHMGAMTAETLIEVGRTIRKVADRFVGGPASGGCRP